MSIRGKSRGLRPRAAFLLLCLLAIQGCATGYVASLGVDRTMVHPMEAYSGPGGDVAVGVKFYVSHPWPRNKGSRTYYRIIHADSAAVVRCTEVNGIAPLESAVAWRETGWGDHRWRGSTFGGGCPARPADPGAVPPVPERKRLCVLVSEREESSWRILPGLTSRRDDLPSLLPAGFSEGVRVTRPPHCLSFPIGSGVDPTHQVMGEFRLDSDLYRHRAWWGYPAQLLQVPAAAIDVVLVPIFFIMMVRNPPR